MYGVFSMASGFTDVEVVERKIGGALSCYSVFNIDVQRVDGRR